MGRNWRGASPLLPTSTLLASVGPNGNPNLEKPLKACTALRGQKQKHPQFFLRSSLMPALPTKQSHLATESHRRGPAGRGTASWGLWAAHNDDQRSMLVSQLRREHGPHHHLRSLQLRTLLPPEPPAADTSLPGCPQVLHTGCFTLGASHRVLPTPSSKPPPTWRGHASTSCTLQTEELGAKHRFPRTTISSAQTNAASLCEPQSLKTKARGRKRT